MTSASDITMLLTSDGREWGQYLSDKLKAFPRVSHSSLALDEQVYQNTPEVTLACLHSPVLLLLATPHLLQYMRDRATCFSQTLQEAPATSALVVILLLERQEVDDVTGDAYVTGGWKYFDAGYDAKDVQKMIAGVLDVVDECQSAKEKAEKAEKAAGEKAAVEGAAAEKGAGRAGKGETAGKQKSPPPPPTKPKPSRLVELFPSTLYEVSVHG